MSADFLAQQIALVQRAIGRPFDSVDPSLNDEITRNVAAVLDSYGVQDVRNLHYVENQALDVMFFFDVTTGKTIPNPVTATMRWDGDPKAQKLVGYFVARFDTYWIYCVVREGFPIFYAAKYHNENEWQTAFHAIAGLVAIGVSAGFAGLAMEIGSAVIGGEAAAAYPAVAQGIGQAAISTALNGGNVQGAVVSAVSGGLGGGMGGLVTTATDSAIAGSVAAAATTAAIRGGNIESAALQSLAANGINSASGIFSSSGSTSMDDGTDVLTVDYSAPLTDPTGANAGYFDPTYYGMDNSVPDYTGASGYHDPVWSVNGSSEGATLPMPGATSPPPGPNGVVATGSDGSSLTSLALTALKLVQGWNAAGQPPIRTANAVTRPNANGTITNLSTGQTVQMPRGTPYLLPNGTLVTNNGDGTYTTVSSNGTTSTTAYVGTTILGGLGGLSSIPPIVLFGGAALALILLTGSRRN